MAPKGEVAPPRLFDIVEDDLDLVVHVEMGQEHARFDGVVQISIKAPAPVER